MTNRDIETLKKMVYAWKTFSPSIANVLEDIEPFIKGLIPEERWRSMDSAPKDGTHILVVWACDRPSFGHCGNPPIPQWWEAVVHWFDTGTEAGFWLSSGGDSDAVELATHWRPLPPAPETSKEVLP